jgi:tetratricopeptide (TPR) repeat protein
MREALDLAAAQLDKSPPDDPEVEAAVRHTVGMAYRELGLYDQAEEHLKRVVAIQEKRAGDKAHATVLARHKLASVLAERGQNEAAEPMLRQAVADYKALLPLAQGEERAALEADLSDGLNDFGNTLTNIGKPREAIDVYKELGELDKRIHGETSDNYIIGLYNLAILYDTIGEYDEEDRLTKKAFTLFTANHPEERAEYAYYLDTLGVLALRRRDVEAAETYNRRALRIRTQFLGEEHSLTAFSMANVAEGLHLQGKDAEALRLLQKAIGIQKRTQGDRSRKVAYELDRLGRIQQDMGNLRQAERSDREAISILTDDSGAIHPHAAPYLRRLGTVLESENRLEEAERCYREALRVERASLPAGNPEIDESLMNLGRLLMRTGRAAEAEPLFLECLDNEKGRSPSAYRPASGAEKAVQDARRAQGRG